MYAPAPSAAELAAFGLRLEDYGDEIVEVWPENHRAFEVFSAMQTQWRIAPRGMGGSSPIGLDYQALHAVMGLMGVPKKEQQSVFLDVQIMEIAALKTVGEQPQ